MSKFHKWLSGLPTTQFRVLTGAFGFISVVVVGVILRKEVPESVLWFILGWSFADVVHFASKRFSQHKAPAPKEDK